MGAFSDSYIFFGICIDMMIVMIMMKVGGVHSVTLGDEAARSRGTQKSVLERKAPSTFPLLIEMRERSHWVAHQVKVLIKISNEKRLGGILVNVSQYSHEYF